MIIIKFRFFKNLLHKKRAQKINFKLLDMRYFLSESRRESFWIGVAKKNSTLIRFDGANRVVWPEPETQSGDEHFSTVYSDDQESWKRIFKFF